MKGKGNVTISSGAVTSLGPTRQVASNGDPRREALIDFHSSVRRDAPDIHFAEGELVAVAGLSRFDK